MRYTVHLQETAQKPGLRVGKKCHRRPAVSIILTYGNVWPFCPRFWTASDLILTYGNAWSAANCTESLETPLKYVSFTPPVTLSDSQGIDNDLLQ